jgi:predicted transcriptional regulator
MIMTAEKTYSVKEAANEVRLSRAIVSRLCQRGLIGKKYEFPDALQHVYRLNDEDLKTLRDRKNEWQKKLRKKSA